MARAVIVGGSMAGLLAGNMLIRQGWTVDILERTHESLEARGAGIVPQRSLLAALARAGVEVRPDIGIHIEKRVAYDKAGRAFASRAYDQYATSWSLIYNLLHKNFPSDQFHAGANVVGITQTTHDATVTLADGRTFTGDVAIAADGMRSTLRGTVFPDAKPHYVGYVAWRGMLEEREASRDFVATCFSSLNFSFPDGEELIGYPVAGPDSSVEPGRRRFNIMWYRPVAPGPALRDMFTGRDGVHYEHGIPPGLCRRQKTKRGCAVPPTAVA
jgi:2-polyprenyl-6-methoxyphenol hydroxylase-like FAD-dependent oxidoreductase